MKASDEAYRARIPNSICWGCGYNNTDEGAAPMCDCGYYGFPQRPRKKKCKHFTKDDPRFDYDEDEHFFADLDDYYNNDDIYND